MPSRAPKKQENGYVTDKQECCDLWSRRGHRQCHCPCLRTRGGQGVPDRSSDGFGRCCGQGDPGRWREGPDGSGRCAALAGHREGSGHRGPEGSNARPETATIREAYGRFANALGITFEQVEAQNAAMTPLRRLPKLVEVANVAAFMASDQASAMTATVANLSCGLLAD